MTNGKSKDHAEDEVEKLPFFLPCCRWSLSFIISTPFALIRTTLEMRNRCGLAMRSSLFLLLVVLLLTSLPLIQAGGSVKNNNNKVRGECIPYQTDLSGYHCHRPTTNSTASTSSSTSSSPSSCIDENEQCATWSKQGECTSNPHYMLLHCAKSCNSCVSAHAGTTQIVGDESDLINARLVLDHVISTEHYLREEVLYKVHYLQTCLNRHELCTVWALQGHCEDGSETQEYMEQKCAPACKTCHKTVK
jgi:ShK domain-like